MKLKSSLTLFIAMAALAGLSLGANAQETESGQSGTFVLAIHGGDGVRDRDQMTPEMETAYRDALKQSLEAGYKVLNDGGSSVAAVEAAIMVMEDSPLFNSGKGASFNREGYNELDSSIMDGATLDAGAVAVVQRVKNPIHLARTIMEDSPHVMMAGTGALEFARSQGLDIVPSHYFWTERKWSSLQRRLKQGTQYGRRPKREEKPENDSASRASLNGFDKGLFGTVGAVALDPFGNLAAGTSTGGREGKLPGRIGDSPIIGAGTYANNATLAASSTGLGEYVIRQVGTKLISDLMEYKGLSADEAVADVMQRIIDMGGGMGVVAIDKHGGIVMRYSGNGMYRGFVREDGKINVLVYEK